MDSKNMNTSNKYKYQNVNVNDIKMNDLNTKYFHMYEGKSSSSNGTTFQQLVTSIETNGLRNPIILTHDFKILAGHRRYQAFLRLNKPEIPALIHVNKLTPAQEEFELIDDNIQHRSYNYQIEEQLRKRRYELYAELIPGFHARIASKENRITAKEMSEKTGTSLTKAKKDLGTYKKQETERIKKIIYAKDGIDEADIISVFNLLGRALTKYKTANVKTRKKMDVYINKFIKDVNKL